MKNNYVSIFVFTATAVMSISSFAKDGNHAENAYPIRAVSEQKNNSVKSIENISLISPPTKNSLNNVVSPNESDDSGPIHHARSQYIPFGGWNQHHQK